MARVVRFIGLHMDHDGDVEAIRYQEAVYMVDLDTGEKHWKDQDVEALPVERLAEVLPMAHAALLHGHKKAHARADLAEHALEGEKQARRALQEQLDHAMANPGGEPAKKLSFWDRILGRK